MQRHNFKWEDEPFEILIHRYPQCRAALRWWCNDFERKSERESSFNIGYNQYLKEFMVANPPQFKISNKCCHYAKKLVAKRFKRQESFDLNIYGVRKAEGGARKSAYKTCFSSNEEGGDEYRPIFWYLSDTKKYMKRIIIFKIVDAMVNMDLKGLGARDVRIPRISRMN